MICVGCAICPISAVCAVCAVCVICAVLPCVLLEAMVCRPLFFHVLIFNHLVIPFLIEKHNVDGIYPPKQNTVVYAGCVVCAIHASCTVYAVCAICSFCDVCAVCAVSWHIVSPPLV